MVCKHKDGRKDEFWYPSYIGLWKNQTVRSLCLCGCLGPSYYTPHHTAQPLDENKAEQGLAKGHPKLFWALFRAGGCMGGCSIYIYI